MITYPCKQLVMVAKLGLLRIENISCASFKAALRASFELLRPSLLQDVLVELLAIKSGSRCKPEVASESVLTIQRHPCDNLVCKRLLRLDI